MPYPLLQLFSKKAKTKKPHTTLEERVQILLSLQNGHITRQIAKSTNISPSTVSHINKRLREQHSLKDAPKPGPKMYRRKENISISSPTICRILHANGLRQLEFAKEHEHWTIEDWSKTIWSDESKIDGMMDAKLYQQILHKDFMNTIKDHGFNVKEVIFQQDGDPKHMEDLWNKIQQVWFEIDVETCTNLIHSIPE
ncbi:3523_t:CDS:2 [Entrophospora sp. SA101]|nr:10958_t:CDS:2 [Entrophospora sp. SA101]CAJ0869496.1 3523_t:CDS:2 [Entrophospora sp. SA101]